MIWKLSYWQFLSVLKPFGNYLRQKQTLLFSTNSKLNAAIKTLNFETEKMQTCLYIATLYQTRKKWSTILGSKNLNSGCSSNFLHKISHLVTHKSC